MTVHLLPSSQIHVLVAFFVPGANSQKVKVAAGEGNTLEKLAKKVTLWLTEGVQLLQERTQTLRAGMNFHCSWACIIRSVRTTQKSPPSWSLNTSCAEIRTSKNLEFRLRWVVREHMSSWQTANTLTSYQGDDLLQLSTKCKPAPFLKSPCAYVRQNLEKEKKENITARCIQDGSSIVAALL